MKFWLGRLAFILMVVAGAMMCLMMVHITIDVAMKYFLNAPWQGTVETVSYYYMIGAIYLPLAYVELRGKHIAVDLFYDRFSPRYKLIATVFAHLCAMLFFGILAFQGWIDAVKSFQIGEIIMGSITLHIWPSRFFLPISFTLVTLVTFLRLVEEVYFGRPVPTTFAQLFRD